MTEMQRQFEEWFDVEKKHFINHEEVFRNVFWQAWQASRAAIVVKMSEYEFGNTHRNILIDDFKAALDDLGVSYE